MRPGQIPKSDYPLGLTITTPDGEGDAIKEKRGDPWKVRLPGRRFEVFGGCTKILEQIRIATRADLRLPKDKRGWCETRWRETGWREKLKTFTNKTPR
jgi:hypothetical protein